MRRSLYVLMPRPSLHPVGIGVASLAVAVLIAAATGQRAHYAERVAVAGGFAIHAPASFTVVEESLATLGAEGVVLQSTGSAPRSFRTFLPEMCARRLAQLRTSRIGGLYGP